METLKEEIINKKEYKINENFVNELNSCLQEGIKINEPMKKYTTFRIGGNAKYFCKVKNRFELIEVLKIAKKYDVQIYIIGYGSNILVSDNGLDGLVIKIELNEITITSKEIENNNDTENSIEKNNEKKYKYYLKADSGCSLKEVIKKASENSLGSLASMFGIPGTVGGAIYMNAGAFELEIKDVVVKTEYINPNTLEIGILEGEAQEFSYRNSKVKQDNLIVLSATFELDKVNKDEELAKMDYIINRREFYQPLEYPSAGSTFKRGKDFIVSLLIDECNLKGTKVNDAEVSTKHAGFLINKGSASAKDVLELVEIVKKEVKKQKGKDIELEVITLGDINK